MRRLLLSSVLLTAIGPFSSSCSGPGGAVLPLVVQEDPKLVVPVERALAELPRL